MRKEVKDKLVDSKSHGRLENIHLFSQIALNAMMVIAVALGGLWALFNTVYIKQEQEISSFTLRELRQKTAQAPVMSSSLKTHVIASTEGWATVQAKVTISNQGTQLARVILNDSALSLVEVEFEEGWPRFVAERGIGDTRYRGVSKVVHDYIDVGAGESYEVSYIFQIHKSGHYLVRFLAAMQGDHYDEFKKKVNAPLAMQYSTGADQYVVIP